MVKPYIKLPYLKWWFRKLTWKNKICIKSKFLQLFCKFVQSLTLIELDLLFGRA